jgi:uncharacterized UPF0146 family protein
MRPRELADQPVGAKQAQLATDPGRAPAALMAGRGRVGEEEALQIPVPEPVQGELAATHGGEQGPIVGAEWTEGPDPAAVPLRGPAEAVGGRGAEPGCQQRALDFVPATSLRPNNVTGPDKVRGGCGPQDASRPPCSEEATMSLDNRVAIVTGAGHGIGRAIAVALAQAGAHVAAVDIDPAAARATADAVSAAGRKGVALEIDVGDLASIEGMVRRATDSFGHIDVLVNNAAVSRRAYIMDLTEDDWERIMRVNAKGVFFCLQRVAREMIPRRSGVNDTLRKSHGSPARHRG